MEIQEYISKVNEQFKTGLTTEHSYRGFLQQLLSTLLPDFVVINEPSRFECGAPDYIITTKKVQSPVFFLEAKDLDNRDLDGRKSNKEQFDRYKKSLDHIIFTDYLDFHLYEEGEWKENVRLADIQGNDIVLCEENLSKFQSLIEHIATTKPKPITSATKLATQMASKARLLSEIIKEAFDMAQKNDKWLDKNKQLQAGLDAFKSVLISDLTIDKYADIYAQTVAYGMFAARLHDNTPEDFTRQEAANLIPKSNPLLRQVFQQLAGYDLDERIAWVVDDLVNVFRATDIRKVMKVYTRNKRHSDPLIHFYEDFLKAYNPTIRKDNGVWYTPLPIVQFIVRVVDDILQHDFNIPDGLADYSKSIYEIHNDKYDEAKTKEQEVPAKIKKELHRVQILDPATGTGTFLAEVVNQIYDKYRDNQGMWQSYVDEHLIPRLYGFEILMASYAVAHLKLDMLLENTGYKPNNDKRLNIYLTNSLESDHKDTGSAWSYWLTKEAKEANRVKRDCPVMVMIGNPPYNNSSTNRSNWIKKLIKDYKVDLNEKKLNLDDDYIKFIRLSQHYIEKNTSGIVGFITNYTYIDGITHRQMRKSLLESYDKIYVVNLHGDVRSKDISPDGSKDENVFEITKGVCISIFVKTGLKEKNTFGKVYYKDLYGKRDIKFDYLSSHGIYDTDFQEVTISAPNYFFVPKDFSLKDEMKKFIPLNYLLCTFAQGLQTKCDALNVLYTEYDRQEVFTDFQNMSVEELKKKYNVKEGKDWTFKEGKEDLSHNNVIFTQLNYRPFDDRFTNYTGVKGMMGRPRYSLMKHSKNNLFIISGRQGQVCGKETWNLISISDKMVDMNVFYRGGAYVFPLYLYTDNFGTREKVPNLNPEGWKKFNDAVGRETTPEELLGYIFAVLHSTTYRERYKEFLKIDFPRIPLPESVDEFDRLIDLGNKLLDLYLMRNTGTWKIETIFPVSEDRTVVEQYKYADGKVWINNTQYFGNVPETVWNFYIGGYQPAQKWLKDRKGRALSFDDIKHYQHIIYALTETDRLMKEIG